ncbi:hypothetical protein LAZ67_X001661 [Cordylochernes scorpioides]|uniref:Uncharacterized protein n=1 Tax=Cordylochernes scorpioides TaxID=51811 RepID=A0ABY6LT30_9ARAC|nr:hypothetical protein LAZ67_X001661 [Cordylochernes scorpioides]
MVVEHPLNTTFTTFFQLCQEDPFFPYTIPLINRGRYFVKIIREYVLLHDAVVCYALGKVYIVLFINAECSFLGMLLLIVRGPTSFVSLRTVSKPVKNLVCLKETNTHTHTYWDTTLTKAGQISFPQQIRILFAIFSTYNR